jgi:hypothetical protein
MASDNRQPNNVIRVTHTSPATVVLVGYAGDVAVATLTCHPPIENSGPQNRDQSLYAVKANPSYP